MFLLNNKIVEIMKKVFMSMAIVAAMFAAASCACNNSQPVEAEVAGGCSGNCADCADGCSEELCAACDSTATEVCETVAE